MWESFFATLECELIDRSTYRTHDEARAAIFDFIEGFYNHAPSPLVAALSVTRTLRESSGGPRLT